MNDNQCKFLQLHDLKNYCFDGIDFGYKCFSYLKAEAKFFQKKVAEAKIIYLGIKKISPGYRLVEKRLLEIESNK
jgi:hypothetical protein